MPPVSSSERCEEALGDLDVLVCNAGVTRDGLIARLTPEDWTTVIDTNLAGSFFLCQAASRRMIRRRQGSIVLMSSVVGVHGNAGQTNYAASKAGLIGLSKSLARELGGAQHSRQRRRSGLHCNRTDWRPLRGAAPGNPRLDAPQAPRGTGGCRTSGALPRLGCRVVRHGCGSRRRRWVGDVMRR